MFWSPTLPRLAFGVEKLISASPLPSARCSAWRPIRRRMKTQCVTGTKTVIANCAPTSQRGEDNADQERKICLAGTSDVGKASTSIERVDFRIIHTNSEESNMELTTEMVKKSVPTNNMNLHFLKPILAVCLVSPTFSFAQVCTGQTGTIGAFAVTASCSNGAQTGVNQARIQNWNHSCTFSFSPAATPADFSVSIQGLNNAPYEVVSFVFNGGSTPYSLSASELSPGYVLSGSGASTNTSAAADGTSFFSFANAPSSVSSITINQAGAGGTFYAGLCMTPASATAAPIPTLSEWAMIFLASLMGLFAFTRIRRQS
jgi:hypothetical protein